MAENGKIAKEKTETVVAKKCGVIMPISEMGDYPASHWAEVREILTAAINDAGFQADLVSNAPETAFIHKTIVQNLHQNEIVVCDVSGKNPNVMFELGIRLTFDKPTVIVKDDKTTYSFDTSPIEHVPYPANLRFAKVNEFKARLTEKIKSTHEAAKNSKYSPFLKAFGEFTVPRLDQKEVTFEEFMLQELQGIRTQLTLMQRRSRDRGTFIGPSKSPTVEFKLPAATPPDFLMFVQDLSFVEHVSARIIDDGVLLRIWAKDRASMNDVLKIEKAVRDWLAGAGITEVVGGIFPIRAETTEKG